MKTRVRIEAEDRIMWVKVHDEEGHDRGSSAVEEGEWCTLWGIDHGVYSLEAHGVENKRYVSEGTFTLLGRGEIVTVRVVPDKVAEPRDRDMLTW